MTTDNFRLYLQNRLIQTGQTGGQLYCDTSPFSVPWYRHHLPSSLMIGNCNMFIAQVSAYAGLNYAQNSFVWRRIELSRVKS
jgi:hypothetical protein